MQTPVKVLPVTTRIFDVFLHDGWENWSRWMVRRDGFITMIDGTIPEPPQRKVIIDNLKARNLKARKEIHEWV